MPLWINQEMFDPLLTKSKLYFSNRFKGPGKTRCNVYQLLWFTIKGRRVVVVHVAARFRRYLRCPHFQGDSSLAARTAAVRQATDCFRGAQFWGAAWYWGAGEGFVPPELCLFLRQGAWYCRVRVGWSWIFSLRCGGTTVDVNVLQWWVEIIIVRSEFSVRVNRTGRIAITTDTIFFVYVRIASFGLPSVVEIIESIKGK